MIDVATMGHTYNDGTLSLSCAETAKLIRQALKRFSGQKFSVRSRTYSGGASIDVSWTDGPTNEEVDKVVRAFNGADFDGMVDLKTYNDHWLEQDGSVVLAKRGGSGVSYETELYDAPSANARLVSLGANFVFTHRDLSDEFKQASIPAFEELHGPYDPDKEYDAHGHPWREKGSALLYYVAMRRAA